MEAKKLKVFYDGNCHLCSKEIETYRKKDSQGKLELVDISEPNFNAKSEGLDPEKTQKLFHVKNKDGEILSGVDAFQAIWKELNIFKPLQFMAETPLTKYFMNIGYKGFATIRPFLPKKNKCNDGSCNI